MTELEIMQHAKTYMDKLAQGIDPISGQSVPDDSVLNNVRLARCFFYVSGVLEKVIANGGKVSKDAKNSFFITSEELARVPLSQEPVRISQFIDTMMDAINDPGRKKLNAVVITKWLMGKGYMTKMDSPDGKSQRVPTEAGEQIGLSTKMTDGINGTYLSVFYSVDAQRFLLEHMQEILNAG